MSGRLDNLLLPIKLNCNMESKEVHESPWEVEFGERHIEAKAVLSLA